MPGILYDRDAEDRFVSGIFAAVVGKGLTESLRAFVEIAYSQVARDRSGGKVGYVELPTAPVEGVDP